jgi:thioredoxin 1
MKHFILALAALFTSIAFSADFPAGSPAFHASLDAAKKAAVVSGKPIVVVFSASYCPPCMMMKKRVYPSAEVKPLHSSFEWVYVDTGLEENAEVARAYDVNPIPHIQFLNKDAKPFSSWLGGADPKQFAAILKHVLKETSKS